MKVLNILHYPVFNGPANTCALISDELLDNNTSQFTYGRLK